MRTVADSVYEEPVFARPAAFSDSDENGIGGEPALSARPEAEAADRRYRLWVLRQWKQGGQSLGPIVGIGLASGFIAVVCALLKDCVGIGSLAVVIGAPVAEEVSKVICPLMVLEKRPWIFPSRGLIVALCALSGLVFASVENVLYFTCYIPQEALTEGVVAWRLSVCTLMHVAATTVAGWGLAREWRRAAACAGRFGVSHTLPWLFAAMLLHGAYNLCALLYETVVAH